MGTGPEVREGFDLALTEVLGDGRHVFVKGDICDGALVAKLLAERERQARIILGQLGELSGYRAAAGNPRPVTRYVAKLPSQWPPS